MIKRTMAAGQPRILGVLAAAEFMLVLDVSIVNVALPALDRDLHFNPDGLEWVVNAYVLMFAGMLLLGGRMADVLGGRRVFLAAAAGFTVASLACGLAQSAGALVAERALQGTAAGILSPCTLSLLTATYRGGDVRARALSVWTAVATAGGALGAVAGGLLLGALSWRAIFLVNVPIGLALVILARARLPRAPAPRERVLDVPGAITATLGVAALVWALMRAARSSWVSPDVLSAFAGVALLLGAFVRIERRQHSPLVPFAVFRSRALAAGNLLSFLSFVPVFATWYLLTLYLQGARGLSAPITGCALAPLSLAMVAGSSAGFRLLRMADPRRLFLAGGILAAVGAGGVASASPGTPVAAIVAAAALIMIGGGLMLAPATVAAMAPLRPEQAGLGSGLLNTSRQLGGVLGLTVIGGVALPAHLSPPTVGLHLGAGELVAAVVFLVTASVGSRVLPAPTGGRVHGARAAALNCGPARRMRPPRRSGGRPTGVRRGSAGPWAP